MDTLDSLVSWAHRWKIPPAALRELCAQSIQVETVPKEKGRTGEAMVLSQVRVEAAQKGYYLYRNNRGAGKLANGNFIRWGLANDSQKLGDKWKSGDNIGWKSRVIQPEDVGCVFAQFASVEVKASDWKFSGTIEEMAQVQWATLVNACGGIALIVNSVGKL